MKTLLVMAHPDDEVCFGWPLLQCAEGQCEIILCSSHNSRVKGHEHKGQAAIDLWGSRGVPITVMGFSDGFAAHESQAAFCDELLSLLGRTPSDQVYTHNPLGEYGHADHQLVWSVCMQSDKRVVFFSDIWIARSWAPWDTVSQRLRSFCFRNVLREVECDVSWYERCKEHYRSRGLWTWGGPDIGKCNICRI